MENADTILGFAQQIVVFAIRVRLAIVGSRLTVDEVKTNSRTDLAWRNWKITDIEKEDDESCRMGFFHLQYEATPDLNMKASVILPRHCISKNHPQI
jgi:hypothetical protein